MKERAFVLVRADEQIDGVLPPVRERQRQILGYQITVDDEIAAANRGEHLGRGFRARLGDRGDAGIGQGFGSGFLGARKRAGARHAEAHEAAALRDRAVKESFRTRRGDERAVRFAPADSPNTVTLPGSPPKAAMLRCTHCSATIASSMP